MINDAMQAPQNGRNTLLQVIRPDLVPEATIVFLAGFQEYRHDFVSFRHGCEGVLI
jgi:hypothetical protein